MDNSGAPNSSSRRRSPSTPPRSTCVRSRLLHASSLSEYNQSSALIHVSLARLSPSGTMPRFSASAFSSSIFIFSSSAARQVGLVSGNAYCSATAPPPLGRSSYQLPQAPHEASRSFTKLHEATWAAVGSTLACGVPLDGLAGDGSGGILTGLGGTALGGAGFLSVAGVAAPLGVPRKVRNGSMSERVAPVSYSYSYSSSAG